MAATEAASAGRPESAIRRAPGGGFGTGGSYGLRSRPPSGRASAPGFPTFVPPPASKSVKGIRQTQNGAHVLENASRTPRTEKEALLDGPDERDGHPAGAPGSGSEAESAALLDGCRRGDVAAFERLYTLHGARMKSIARNLLGLETDAEDAVQETFLKVYRGAGSFRGSATLSTWIYRILVNTCYDLLRRRRRHPEDALESPAESGAVPAGLHAPAADQPLRISIDQSMSKLAPKQRAVFLLSAVEGFSHREIADVLDLSEGASRSLLFEAKRKLQDLLWASGAGRRAAR